VFVCSGFGVWVVEEGASERREFEEVAAKGEGVNEVPLLSEPSELGLPAGR
jgi:hypothetical protein